MVIKDKKLQSQLVPFSYNQKQVGEASHLLVFCIESQIDTTFITNYFELNYLLLCCTLLV